MMMSLLLPLLLLCYCRSMDTILYVNAIIMRPDDKRLFQISLSKTFRTTKYVIYVKSNHYRSCKNTAHNFPSWLLSIFWAACISGKLLRGDGKAESHAISAIFITHTICKSLSPFLHSTSETLVIAFLSSSSSHIV